MNRLGRASRNKPQNDTTDFLLREPLQANTALLNQKASATILGGSLTSWKKT